MSRTFQYSNPLARTIIFIVVIVLANCGFTTSFTRISSGDNGTFRRRSGSRVVTSGTSAGTKLVGGTKQRRFAEKDQATGNANNEVSLDIPDMSDVGFIILAGGTGSRMKATMPKQFLTLRGKPVLHHSMDLFLEQLPAFLKSRGRKCPPHVILVLDPMYQPEYQKFVDHYGGRLTFASPGKERQGSVENGLHALRNLAATTKYAAIHDSARPLVTIQEVCNVVNDAKEVGAAVLGVPCKATIKESEDGAFVTRTIPRSRLWEVHTPQVILIDMLNEGFRKVAENDWEVTDDVSIIELLGKPVKITKGEYTNLKITTPEDMDVAEAILKDRYQKKKTEVASQT